MRVVLCNGCFDPLTYGHLLHFQQARNFGEFLIVSITSDESVRKEKGEGRPVLNELQRRDFIQSLRCVDSTLIVPSDLWALQIVKPGVFVKGPDYKGKMRREVKEFCMERGIPIRFTDAPKWSATALIDELRSR